MKNLILWVGILFLSFGCVNRPYELALSHQNVVQLRSTAGNAGSGFFVKNSENYTYCLTAKHVIKSNSFFVSPVIYIDGEAAKIVAIDTNSDLALLKIKRRKCNVLDFENPVIGQDVIGKGYIFIGIDLFEVNQFGKVSSINKNFDVIIVNVGIREGMSGGPIVNLNNKVAGLISCVPTYEKLPNYTIGICVSANRCKNFVEKAYDRDIKDH